MPTSGTFKLKFGLNTTNIFDKNSKNTDIQTELNLLDNLSAVLVSGDYTNGFTITFTGDDGEKDQPLLEIADNSLSDGSPIIITASEQTKGFLSHVDIEMIAQNTGPISANSGSLTIIETPVSGIESLTNLEDASSGRDLESDSDYKLRRLELLQRSGVATIEGIRNKLLGVEDVIQAIIIENPLLTTDINGRPGKSFESIVLGGEDQAIANTIFESKPAGIESHGTILKTVVDSQGISHAIKLSRPTEKDIFLIVTIVPNNNPAEGDTYPTNGDILIKTAILEFVNDFKIGQDVIVSQFFTPINTVTGIHGIQIFVGLNPSPTLSDNIAISPTEIARFDSVRITVNS
ncbi:MAG: hypothetical protein GY710_24440 [Desulfobacteraceae bacterium]|nr:hypothetical protein [Desulfobacteraceae bacterium]